MAHAYNLTAVLSMQDEYSSVDERGRSFMPLVLNCPRVVVCKVSACGLHPVIQRLAKVTLLR